MFPLIPTIMATKAGIDILKQAKQFFYPDKTLGEAQALMEKSIANNVESLQEQVRTHRQVIDKLVEQVKADKEMIEQHNEVLIQLSEASEQIAMALSKLRIAAYMAIGLGGAALLVTILFKVVT